MEAYKQPSWYVRYVDPATVSPEQLEAWRKETEECDKANRQILKERQEKYKLIMDLIKQVYGENSDSYKYMRKKYLGFIPSFSFSDLERRIMAAREEIAKKEKEKVYQIEHQALMGRAVVWLQAKGKTLGVDFSIGDAICGANALAAEEEIARKKESGIWRGFNGQNCDGPCEGWDGVSHRCQCGNRRVDWTSGDNHSFECPHVYGEAY
ncbi:MAG: hypothetical protein ABIJ57_01360 [Pseudomonadota bacterium]